MRSSIGCFTLLMMSCAGCCCLRIPTFGLWPELDEAELRAAVQAAPLTVDHLCKRGEECVAVEGAEISVTPIGWNPLTGAVMAAVQVEATCKASEDGTLKPLVCAGALLAVYDETPAGLSLRHVTEETMLGNAPSGLSLEAYEDGLSEGDGFDWD